MGWGWVLLAAYKDTRACLHGGVLITRAIFFYSSFFFFSPSFPPIFSVYEGGACLCHRHDGICAFKDFLIAGGACGSGPQPSQW